MKALLVLALLAVDGGTPKPCVVTIQPSGVKRACAPEPKPPAKCEVLVRLPDGTSKTIPCR